MREIEFRGKSIMDNGYGEWLYSSGINYGDDVELMYCDEETSETWFYVDKETLGQYTGLKDKNGKKIFEGDIIEYKVEKWINLILVKWGKVEFSFLEKYNKRWQRTTYQGVYKYGTIIGNIWDNPELLEDK